MMEQRSTGFANKVDVGAAERASQKPPSVQLQIRRARARFRNLNSFALKSKMSGRPELPIIELQSQNRKFAGANLDNKR